MGCEPPQAIRRFTLASRVTRLLRVLAMFPSMSFGTRNLVLAEFRSRLLKSNRKNAPNRNGACSPKLRLRAILSPNSAWCRVYEVRSVTANPFDNTEKSVPVRAVSLVRNGDNGGSIGIRTLETVPRLHTFQACAFDHSATDPLRGVYRQVMGWRKGRRCRFSLEILALCSIRRKCARQVRQRDRAAADKTRSGRRKSGRGR
jgi:hypothetical protein